MRTVLLLLLLAQASPTPALRPGAERETAQQQTDGRRPPNDQSSAPKQSPVVTSQLPAASEEKDASRNAATGGWGTWSDTAIAALTFVLALLAAIQIGVMLATNKHTRAIERGYAHVPGVDGFEGYAIRSRATILLSVSNSGNTPVTINRISSGLLVVLNGHKAPQPLPSIESEVVDFVVAKDKTAQWGATLEEPTEEQFNAVIGGKARLVILGRIEYSDVFNRHHTSEFGFRYREFTFSELRRDQDNAEHPSQHSTGEWAVEPGYSRWS